MLANTITFHFRSFKTLLKSQSSIKVPERMFFTAKFFNFQESKTEMCLLRLPYDQAKTLEQQRNVQGGTQELLQDSSYTLMRYNNVAVGSLHNLSDLEKDYKTLKDDIKLSYDFDPTILSTVGHDQAHQHALFCKFLDSRALTIDVWNGDNLMHFGSCKVPLYLLMRQNQPRSMRTEEFEVYEAENAERVGKLHLSLENIGREIKMSKNA